MQRLYHEANLDHVAAQLLVKAQTKPQLEAEEFQVVAAELAEQASRLRAHAYRSTRQSTFDRQVVERASDTATSWKRR